MKDLNPRGTAKASRKSPKSHSRNKRLAQLLTVAFLLLGPALPQPMNIGSTPDAITEEMPASAFLGP